MLYDTILYWSVYLYKHKACMAAHNRKSSIQYNWYVMASTKWFSHVPGVIYGFHACMHAWMAFNHIRNDILTKWSYVVGVAVLWVYYNNVMG